MLTKFVQLSSEYHPSKAHPALAIAENVQLPFAGTVESLMLTDDIFAPATAAHVNSSASCVALAYNVKSDVGLTE